METLILAIIIVIIPNNLSLIHNRFLAPERQNITNISNLSEKVPEGCLSLVSYAMTKLSFTVTAVCHLKIEEFNENVP